jgi:hypothetical protein
LSPDYGIIQYSKKIVNFIAVAISNLTGLKLFNAFEVYALKEELGVAKTMQK